MWSDQRLAAGAHWRREIVEAIQRAKVALLLVSVHSLNSPFILDEEIPRLLDRRQREGFIPVIVSPCAWDRVPWLNPSLHDRGMANLYTGLSAHDADVALSQLTVEIGELLMPSPATRPADQAVRFTGQPISLDFKDGDIEDVFKLFADISGSTSSSCHESGAPG